MNDVEVCSITGGPPSGPARQIGAGGGPLEDAGPSRTNPSGRDERDVSSK
jgi:hypothetical protein